MQVTADQTLIQSLLDNTRLSDHVESPAPVDVDPASAVSSVATLRPLVMRPAKGNGGRTLSTEFEPETMLLSPREPRPLNSISGVSRDP